MPAPRVNAERLIDFATAVYASAGMPEVDARLVADTLVQADLWGHQSHGVHGIAAILATISRLQRVPERVASAPCGTPVMGAAPGPRRGPQPPPHAFDAHAP